MRQYRDMASTATPQKESILEIVVALPPNFELIQAALPNASREHTYCYGDKIYNPSGKDVPIDVQYHEYIHSQQQAAHDAGVNGWWTEYLIDPNFRLQQEVEAYGHQYAYAKEKLIAADEETRAKGRRDVALGIGGNKHLGGGVNNILKDILYSMASALSGPEYGSLISYGAAESAIKKYGNNK